MQMLPRTPDSGSSSAMTQVERDFLLWGYDWSSSWAKGSEQMKEAVLFSTPVLKLPHLYHNQHLTDTWSLMLSPDLFSFSFKCLTDSGEISKQNLLSSIFFNGSDMRNPFMILFKQWVVLLLSGNWNCTPSKHSSQFPCHILASTHISILHMPVDTGWNQKILSSNLDHSYKLLHILLAFFLVSLVQIQFGPSHIISEPEELLCLPYSQCLAAQQRLSRKPYAYSSVRDDLMPGKEGCLSDEGDMDRGGRVCVSWKRCSKRRRQPEWN